MLAVKGFRSVLGYPVGISFRSRFFVGRRLWNIRQKIRLGVLEDLAICHCPPVLELARLKIHDLLLTEDLNQIADEVNLL